MSLFTWPAWSVHCSIIVLETSPCNLLTVEASSFTIAGRGKALLLLLFLSIIAAQWQWVSHVLNDLLAQPSKKQTYGSIYVCI